VDIPEHIRGRHWKAGDTSTRPHELEKTEKKKGNEGRKPKKTAVRRGAFLQEGKKIA